MPKVMHETTATTIAVQYDLDIHPCNASIINITNKMSRELSYIKIRHNFDDNYAISLVDPGTHKNTHIVDAILLHPIHQCLFFLYEHTETFIPCAESHSISATERSRSIVLQDKQAIEVLFTDISSRIGFQWSFDWEGDQYRWYVKGSLSLLVSSFIETSRWSRA